MMVIMVVMAMVLARVIALEKPIMIIPHSILYLKLIQHIGRMLQISVARVEVMKRMAEMMTRMMMMMVGRLHS